MSALCSSLFVQSMLIFPSRLTFFPSVTEALSGSLSQLFFLERAYTLLKSRTRPCPLHLFSPSLRTDPFLLLLLLLRSPAPRRLHRRLLIAVCTLGILAGLSLGLSSGIITSLLVSRSELLMLDLVSDPPRFLSRPALRQTSRILKCSISSS